MTSEIQMGSLILIPRTVHPRLDSNASLMFVLAQTTVVHGDDCFPLSRTWQNFREKGMVLIRALKNACDQLRDTGDTGAWEHFMELSRETFQLMFRDYMDSALVRSMEEEPDLQIHVRPDGAGLFFPWHLLTLPGRDRPLGMSMPFSYILSNRNKKGGAVDNGDGATLAAVLGAYRVDDHMREEFAFFQKQLENTKIPVHSVDISEGESINNLEMLKDELAGLLECSSVFHWIGHHEVEDHDGALLASDEFSVSIDSLVVRVSSQKLACAFAFLNGCSTGQSDSYADPGTADKLYQLGIDAVLGTVSPINSRSCKEFALRLYKHLLDDPWVHGAHHQSVKEMMEDLDDPSGLLYVLCASPSQRVRLPKKSELSSQAEV